MANYDGQTIEVLNWAKHNPKRDQTTYTWLRLNNDIGTDPDLFGLAPAQKWVWVLILCECSKKNHASFKLNLAYLEHISGVRRPEIEGLISFLLEKPIVRLGDNARPRATAECRGGEGSTTPTNVRTNERTDETNETDGHSRAPAPVTQGVQRPLKEAIEDCVLAWKQTLEKFGHKRPVAEDERQMIGRYIQRKGAENVRLALIGARYEPKTETFDPKKYVSLDRIFLKRKDGKDPFLVFVNWGDEAERKREASKRPAPVAELPLVDDSAAFTEVTPEALALLKNLGVPVPTTDDNDPEQVRATLEAANLGARDEEKRNG